MNHETHETHEKGAMMRELPHHWDLLRSRSRDGIRLSGAIILRTGRGVRGGGPKALAYTHVQTLEKCSGTAKYCKKTVRPNRVWNEEMRAVCRFVIC